MADMAEFVSPKITTASGLSSVIICSHLIRIFPKVFPSEPPPVPKKWSGLRTFKSLKNISLSS